MKFLSCARVIAILVLFIPVAAPVEVFGAEQYPPPGKLVDIGGRKLHLNCTGTAKTAPTVVVENGAGAFSIDWSLVQPEVAKFARICTYDRAGYGWSDPGPAFDTVEQTVSDLHSLLQKAKIRPPYVLVGASLGGTFVRMYQMAYPSEVAGMVLVDIAHEDGNVMRVDGKAKTVSSLSPEKLHEVISQFRESLLKNPPPPPPVPTKIEEPYDKLPTNLQPVANLA